MHSLFLYLPMGFNVYFLKFDNFQAYSSKCIT